MDDKFKSFLWVIKIWGRYKKKQSKILRMVRKKNFKVRGFYGLQKKIEGKHKKKQLKNFLRDKGENF